VSCVANVSENHVTSIFRIEVCRISDMLLKSICPASYVQSSLSARSVLFTLMMKKAPLKSFSSCMRLHGATFQKTVIFILAVRTWNLTTHAVIVNMPYSYQHSSYATGVSSGLETRVTLDRMSRGILGQSTRGVEAGVDQTVQCLATDWTTGRSRFDPRQSRKDFSSSLCVQTGSGAHPASCTMGTGGSFPRG
jgi:hypothetical protein